MLAELPFLGRKINLISKCDIRYEGILYSIDPKESTIALSKVRSFGTEDRVTGRGFIPSKDEVYQYIIFRASDVKDLKLGDSDHLMGLSDPAIIQAVGPKTVNHLSNSNKIGGNNRSGGQNNGPNSRRPRYDRPRRQARRGNQSGQRSGGQRDGRATSEQRNNQQRSGQNQRQSSRGPSRQQRGRGNSRFRRQMSDLRREARREPIKFDSEFDFQKANEEFAELNQKLSEQLNIGDSNPTLTLGDATTGSTPETVAVKEELPAYDKERSFFDSLTCRQTTKPDWRKERRINAETFGVAY